MSAPTMLYVSLHTAEPDLLWLYGPGFVRLAGYAIDNNPVVTTTDIASVVSLMNEAKYVVGHNILALDLPALQLHHGLDLGALVARRAVIDTMIVAIDNDPPFSGDGDRRRYGRAALASRILGDGSRPAGGRAPLAVLGDGFGGLDRIPVADPRYVSSLVNDVEIVRGIAGHLRVSEYAWREHDVMWRLGFIPANGWFVDVDLVDKNIAAQDARVAAGKQQMHDNYGLPLEGKKPHATNAGKAALERAFAACGIEPPRTEKGGLATGRDALEALVAAHPDNEPLRDLCELVVALNSERSTSQMIRSSLTPAGRVHPRVTAHQATGRVSVTKPALTTMGKRSRRNILERSQLLPDPGHLLICADLSQVDARAMALHAQDEGYIAALAPGKDLHDEMAAAVFGESSWDRDDAPHHPRRSDAKAITHATSYGMGARTLAESAGYSVEEAQMQLSQLAIQFPRLEAFKCISRAESVHQILHNAFGRPLRVRPGSEYTQAPALMGQGTARDMMMEGLLRLPLWLLPCLRAIVHDELVFSVPIERLAEAEDELLDALEFDCLLPGTEFPVPVLASLADRGRDWADCYRDEASKWPEVARSHREQSSCTDEACTWHARLLTT